MTPDRIQEIRHRLADWQYDDERAVQDITDLLAALATAEAEGRRQERADICKAIDAHYANGDISREAALRMRQLLPEAQTETPRP